jgi:O-acetyl-ADP-ribose deacetylase (regulator of RNase III)
MRDFFSKNMSKSRLVAKGRHMDANYTREFGSFSVLLNDKLQVEIVESDITKEPVDAIVCSTDSKLEHKKGVSKAIFEAAGSLLKLQSRHYIKKHGKLTKGQCAITESGKLKIITNILHVVGPNWNAFRINSDDAKNKNTKLLETTMETILA